MKGNLTPVYSQLGNRTKNIRYKVSTKVLIFSNDNEIKVVNGTKIKMKWRWILLYMYFSLDTGLRKRSNLPADANLISLTELNLRYSIKSK